MFIICRSVDPYVGTTWNTHTFVVQSVLFPVIKRISTIAPTWIPVIGLSNEAVPDYECYIRLNSLYRRDKCLKPIYGQMSCVSVRDVITPGRSQ